MTTPDAVIPSLTVDVLPADEQVILRLGGELDAGATAAFSKVISDLDPSHRSVLLDLGDVTFIDSTGVGAIIAARRRLDSHFVTMRIINPSKRSRFVFELTGLSDLIITPG